MSMVIGNNRGISNSYQKNTSKAGGYKNVREYSNYLMDKYSCLKPRNNVAVSVTSGLLRKAMSDEKTGQWLERELSKAPDYIKEAQQSASDSFIAKMSSLSSTMSSVTGFDMKA